MITPLLSDAEQQVITMKYSDMTVKQIATALGKSVRSVKRLDNNAWLKLQRSYATIAQWERLAASGESMKKIAASPVKHSLADMMI